MMWSSRSAYRSFLSLPVVRRSFPSLLGVHLGAHGRRQAPPTAWLQHIGLVWIAPCGLFGESVSSRGWSGRQQLDQCRLHSETMPIDQNPLCSFRFRRECPDAEPHTIQHSDCLAAHLATCYHERMSARLPMKQPSTTSRQNCANTLLVTLITMHHRLTATAAIVARAQVTQNRRLGHPTSPEITKDSSTPNITRTDS